MENMNKPKNLGNKCVTCRKYYGYELDSNLECISCKSVYDSKMKYSNTHYELNKKKMPELRHLLDYLKEFGIHKTAERFNTTNYSLRSYLNEFGINLQDYSKKPRSNFKEILDKISDDKLKWEFKAIGITKMRTKYGGDVYRLKEYIYNRIGKPNEN